MNKPQDRLGHGIKVMPGMAARPRTQVDLVGDSQGAQLLVHAVIAPKPKGVVGIDTKENMRGIIDRGNMHERRVLPAMFLARVHPIELRTPAIELMAIECSRD